MKKVAVLSGLVFFAITLLLFLQTQSLAENRIISPEFVYLPAEPKVVYVYIPSQPEIVIIEKPVPKLVEVPAPVIPRWFNSEDELREWLDPFPTWGNPDCDDLQEYLMFEAFKAGFIITPIPVWYGMVFNEPVLNVGISGLIDFGAWTWIGNDLYYVDLRLPYTHYNKLSYTRD